MMWGKPVSGHIKGNQNNLNIYYKKEKEGAGREVGIQDKNNQGEGKEVEGCEAGR